MFLTILDVFVEVGTLKIMPLEQLRKENRVTVHDIDIRVVVMSQSLSHIPFESLYGRRAPLGIQSSYMRCWESEVDFVGVPLLLLETLTKSLELRELPGVQAFRFDDAVEIFCVDDFATRVRIHLYVSLAPIL
jgi:hypothetical protein